MDRFGCKIRSLDETTKLLHHKSTDNNFVVKAKKYLCELVLTSTKSPCMPIPEFNDSGNLPAGIHQAIWQEVEAKLAFNERRQELLQGMRRACESLKMVGCPRIFIGGSFVTDKELPGDFDLCWQDDTVDFLQLQSLDLVLLDFKNKRAAQKAKYG
jgi:hypothetical protein